jgi:hypothetical protein
LTLVGGSLRWARSCAVTLRCEACCIVS